MSEENKINSVTSSVDTGTSIKFIGESDSAGNNLRIEDGKLSGTIVGSVMKDFTGRVDDVTLELSNVPIDGVGGPVEYIDLGDVQGGGPTTALDNNNALAWFNGGGSFADGKSLYDLIGERKIIGYHFKNLKFKSGSGSSAKSITGFGWMEAAPATGGFSRDLRDYSVEERNSIKGFNVHFIYYTQQQVDNIGVVQGMRAYAICA